MILQVSGRTDICALYPQWFVNRLKAGYVLVRNPYHHQQVSQIKISKDVVDCIAFCTKDPQNIMPYLKIIDQLGYKYYFNIGDQVVISAPSDTGMLYGGVSIAQILYQDENHDTIPLGIIRDYPQYSVRGGMLDVARRYFDLDYIEEMGKYMAWFKMNTFHLHINEDSGLGGEYSSSFVVESKKYPVLNTYNLEDGNYVWSQDDYRQMQKNLKQFGVNVITEIDSPGHATIFNLIDPEIVNGSNFDLSNHYDECLDLISSVFDEFLDGDDPVFQSAAVHIGTDESSNTNENMRRYINDLAQYCLSKDNIDKVYFWGNLSVYYGASEIDSKNVVNQIWDSADQRVEQALADGFEIINSTSNSMYLIPGNSNGLHNGYVDMATFYDTWRGCSDFDTHRIGNPTYIASRNYYAQYDLLRGNPQIIGTLFCNWNDRSWANDFDVLDLVLSYIGVISEKSWYGDDDRFESGNDFVEAFEQVADYAPGANPRKYVATNSSIIAKYDFEEMADLKINDLENGYDAQVQAADLATMNEEYLNGKVLQQTTEVRKQRTRLATAKQRVSELEVLLCKIYEDNILGKLSDSRYATLDAQYEIGRASCRERVSSPV